jgi:drug/metabolite transporter (DMT)-like permease
MPTSHQENRLHGIAWMLATMVCFITLDAIMKYGMEHYSLVQVTWGRFFFASLFAAIFCGRRLPALIRSKVPGWQSLRSLLLMTTTGFFNAGIAKLPLATATSIMFLSPILVTLLSIVFLREKVGIRRWMGIAVGFLGALLIVRPWHSTGETYIVGALFLLAAACTNAGYQIVTRRVREDSAMTSLVFTAAAGALVTSLLLPWNWFATPDALGWALLVASGFAGCIGHLCIIRAFQAAPASVVSPFSYSSLVWATLFGFAIWGDLPDGWTWVGAALIVAAGLYIFFRERKVHQIED